METKFVVFRLQEESYSLGLFPTARFDTQAEALDFLEKESSAKNVESDEVNSYIVLPEYTV